MLELQGVSKVFSKKPGAVSRLARVFGAKVHEEKVRAVDSVSLKLFKGEVLALVGESGCGKSTIGRIVAGILKPDVGEVVFRSERANEKSRRREKRRDKLSVQMIFQDPFSSLNPRKRVFDIIAEAPIFHGLVSRASAPEFVDSLMRRVGLDLSFKRRYPHQFSGGQRQRVGIARALAVDPEIVVCDEPVSALDVSIQAQVLNLFMRLRAEFGLTYLFISHDLGVVRHLSDRVMIMYLGRIVEEGPTEELFEAPKHPYTQALLANIPRLDTRNRQLQPLQGEIPSPLNPPTGCHFHPRCSHAMARCRVELPQLQSIGPGRLAACHLNDTG